MKNIITSCRFLLICVTILAVLSCGIFSEENIVARQEAWYSFDPASVMQSIASGKKDVFTVIAPPSKAFYDIEPSNWDSRWNQDDYQLISAVLHETRYGEDVETWLIIDMTFITGCTDVGFGFYNAQFIYYKMDFFNGQKSRIVHLITIDPAYHVASIIEKVYFPVTKNWPVIELDKLKISAEDALRITEANGGYEMRSAIDNACDISLSFVTENPNGRVWRVDYIAYQDANEKNITIYINPYTGEIK
jgi:hypothetical protein